MTLMILAHPDIEQSIANKTIAHTLSKSLPNLEVRNIHQLYPDYKINAQAEQAALLKHDLIILQYPMYWFNMPAILKIWFDEVFTYQFAYGSKGDKLKNKKLLPSLTIGQPEKNFQQGDKHLIDDFLQSIKYSSQYAHMQYIDPCLLYGISTVSGNSPEEIKEKALQHSKILQQLIEQHS